ncbi:hypothetical protein MMC13_001795 [Lambiella insularis]|nr:hypothetical protein [Lambiella insularis]
MSFRPVLPTTYSFNHSSTVIGQLARNAARTPPSDKDPPLVYMDRSLTILGRTFDTHTSECSKEFLAQREFIANGFRDMEKKMDRRFEEMEIKIVGVEKKMDRRFEEVEIKIVGVENRMDQQFKQVDRRFNDIHVLLENTAAITRNGHLRRMHQPINLIKVLKPTSDPNRFVWDSHPQVPKHMKSTYNLGQRAKGIFEPSWEGKSTQQKAQAKQKALRTIHELAKFYNIIILSDEESESDATEVILEERTVDDYMEELLLEWGMDWQKVLKLGMQHMQAQPQQAGAKRAGDTGSREATKKTRGGREEEAD